MNYQRLGSFVAAFFLSTLGWMSVCRADQTSASSSKAGDDALQPAVAQQPLASGPSQAPPNSEKLGDRASSQSSLQSRQGTVAKVEAHSLGDRPAATVYLRNIPVLTFLGDKPSTSAQGSAETKSELETKLETKPEAETAKLSTGPAAASTATGTPNTPLARASALAAQLNQLNREGLDATKIGVKWNDKQQTYVIHLSDRILVEIDPKTAILPDTTRNSTRDALQATNRIRRLLGQANPLKEVANRPQLVAALTPESAEASANVINRGAGWASWYGPGFHGALSASGEVFNQNAMTAAHRSLPFGTRVRVTNTDNGRSVIVRINDRGPFIGGRVIDVSMGAASALGMMGSGVAPVKLEILGR